jgi:hypothetical protein
MSYEKIRENRIKKHGECDDCIYRIEKGDEE